MITLTDLLKGKPDYVKKRILSIVNDNNGQIVVNWDEASKFKGEDRVIEEVYDILTELGILSFNTQGNYLLTGGDVAINPRGSSLSMRYFRNESDAQKFRKAFYENALYPIKMFVGV